MRLELKLFLIFLKQCYFTDIITFIFLNHLILLKYCLNFFTSVSGTLTSASVFKKSSRCDDFIFDVVVVVVGCGGGGDGGGGGDDGGGCCWRFCC